VGAASSEGTDYNSCQQGQNLNLVDSDLQIATQLLEQAPHDQFMHAGAKEECNESRSVFVDFHGRDRGVVDMAKEEVVDRAVPIAGELVPGDAIPPVCVETSVCEESDFCEEVQDALPDDIPRLLVC
jgi:hypothetical protein